MASAKYSENFKAGNVTVIPLIYFQNEFQDMELRKSRARENLQVTSHTKDKRTQISLKRS